VRVARRDFVGPTRGVRPTPQGGFCVEAAVARTGVLEYSDGTRTWREYRPEAEVFAADSLASLRGATVTDLHPEKLVTPETFKAVSCGHAHDNVRRDGDFVVVDLDVQDAALCRLVNAGERREVSCGYTCEVDATPGVTPDGERYDAVQRRIIHNHVALLPPGEGRSGSDVSLRMDGAAVQVRRDTAAGENAMNRTIKVRGVEYRLDADDKAGQVDEKKVATAQDAVDEVQRKADADGAELAAVKGALMDALQKVAALEAKQAAASAAQPPAVTEEMVPEAVQDAICVKRGALRADAAKVLGAEVKLDGLSADEIRKRVVAKAHPTVKLDGLSADTLRGMYEIVVATSTERNDALAAARAPLAPPATQGGGDTRTDAADGTPAALARRTADAWKSKPTMTVNGSR